MGGFIHTPGQIPGLCARELQGLLASRARGLKVDSGLSLARDLAVDVTGEHDRRGGRRIGLERAAGIPLG